MRFGIVNSSGSNDDGENGEKKPVEHEEIEVRGREQYPELETALHYQFKDYSWLERALTHRSAPTKGNKNDYERLEFLGDAVLDLAVADLLLIRHQEAREGELSKMRAALVNTSSLADISRTLNIGPYIILSRGELANGGAERPSILADVLEAVVGAIYREGGYQTALICIETFFGDQLMDVEPRDPKTELQEALHAAGSEAPAYLLECTEGPEHAPAFISVVEVDGQIVGRGRGNTKKASQQAAAEEALKKLAGLDEIDKSFIKEEEED